MIGRALSFIAKVRSALDAGSTLDRDQYTGPVREATAPDSLDMPLDRRLTAIIDHRDQWKAINSALGEPLVLSKLEGRKILIIVSGGVDDELDLLVERLYYLHLKPAGQIKHIILSRYFDPDRDTPETCRERISADINLGGEGPFEVVLIRQEFAADRWATKVNSIAELINHIVSPQWVVEKPTVFAFTFPGKSRDSKFDRKSCPITSCVDLLRELHIERGDTVIFLPEPTRIMRDDIHEWEDNVGKLGGARFRVVAPALKDQAMDLIETNWRLRALSRRMRPGLIEELQRAGIPLSSGGGQ